jgi:hypothetical protein
MTISGHCMGLAILSTIVPFGHSVDVACSRSGMQAFCQLGKDAMLKSSPSACSVLTDLACILLFDSC